MELVTLDGLPIARVIETFNAAFADYAVPISLDRQQFEAMQRRRGFRPELSVGAVEEGRLVGVSLSGFGTWDGSPAAYGSGTGVIPAARNRGLAGEMMHRAVELAAEAGAKTYLLEVLKDNVPARRAYERVGFSISRELECWELLSVESEGSQRLEPNILAGFVPPAGEFCSWSPSWQNSDESLRRAPEPIVTILLEEGTDVAGYAVLCPVSGDLPQFGVAPRFRRGGVGRELLACARRESTAPLRIINADGSDQTTRAFLGALGARGTFGQYEMTRRL